MNHLVNIEILLLQVLSKACEGSMRYEPNFSELCRGSGECVVRSLRTFIARTRGSHLLPARNSRWLQARSGVDAVSSKSDPGDGHMRHGADFFAIIRIVV
jgi:hypothetical protein